MYIFDFFFILHNLLILIFLTNFHEEVKIITKSAIIYPNYVVLCF